MPQSNTFFNPAMTPVERLTAIREAFNRDRSQMTQMLAHKLQIPEAEIMRSLEGDTAHEIESRNA